MAPPRSGARTGPVLKNAATMCAANRLIFQQPRRAEKASSKPSVFEVA